MSRRVDGWTSGRVDGWTSGWVDGCGDGEKGRRGVRRRVNFRILSFRRNHPEGEASEAYLN